MKFTLLSVMTSVFLVSGLRAMAEPAVEASPAAEAAVKPSDGEDIDEMVTPPNPEEMKELIAKMKEMFGDEMKDFNWDEMFGDIHNDEL